jgi:Rps23 Pro-64 3,4-dihydroxylase Tpa1-like proline 4-hydroxylase
MIDYKNLEARESAIAEQFATSKGVRMFVIDNFLEAGVAEKLCRLHDEAIQKSRKDPNAPKKHLHVSRKIGIHRMEMMEHMQQEFFHEINSPKFLRYLEKVTGISPIYADPDLEGGGLHQIYPGGYLNVHTDFNFHPRNKAWQRRLNILLYLNEGWKQEWNGDLEIYDEDVTHVINSIEPVLNRVAVFETSEISFHGHPRPLACPDGVTRKSLAAYFYTDWPDGLEHRDKTNYKLVPWQKTAILDEVNNRRASGIADQEIRDSLTKRYQPAALKELLPDMFAQ